MKRTQQILLLAIIPLVLSGCREYFEEDSKYERPEWLAGKVYTQLIDQPDLSTFARCVELVGYDTIIDVSGSYTVFAPNNEAFSTYFQEHPSYNAPEDMPHEELSRLVKFHIVQNPWSKDQLRSLDVFGWIDTLSLTNNKPRGFKRETLLLDENKKYWVAPKLETRDPNDVIIIDSTKSNRYRRVITDSRKFAPIFFKDYFDIYNLSTQDYSFYFDRSFGNSDDLYFAAGKITGEAIFAENGFVYHIDRVNTPMRNAYQILSEGDDDASYKGYLDLVNQFPEFDYNEEMTFDQPGADLGYTVDSLFDLRYPDITFNITSEKTQPPPGTFGLPGNVTIRYHHGLVVPTDQALNDFISTYFFGEGTWGGLNNAPSHIKRIVINTHMSINPVYQTDLDNGFINGEQDRVFLDQGSIRKVEFGSNGTFIGVDQAIVPRAFVSVTGPVYLQKGFSYVMYGIEEAGLLPALKRDAEEYVFFIKSNQNNRADSSYLYESYNQTFLAWQISETSKTSYNLTTNDLRTFFLNHIGTRKPIGLARKEFIKNLAGNYLVKNNETGEWSGTGPTTKGFRGGEVVHDPAELIFDADNGQTFEIQHWFSFSAASLFSKLVSGYPAFHGLLNKAGLSEERLYEYNFLSESEVYTVFAPSDSALARYPQADSLEGEELRSFLRLHFVQGELIFTDGSNASRYYETTRVDESSTEFSRTYTKIYVEPGTDVIKIRGKSGGDYTNINESSKKTNILTGRNVGEGTETIPRVVNTAVIHQIDTVLVLENLDTK